MVDFYSVFCTIIIYGRYVKGANQRMIRLSYRNTDARIIGAEHGLNTEEEFGNYQETIANIIMDLNKRKDKPGQWLQWMNLGYNEETIWYVKEFASMVRNRFDNVLVLGIGGSALGGLALSEALLKPYWNFLTPEQRDNFPRIFFLDNIDPDSMNGLLNILDLKKTLEMSLQNLAQLLKQCHNI